MSLHRWLRLRRLWLVRQRLLAGTPSVKAAALAFGFWHLGDFAIRRTAAEMAALLQALPGRKHLVAGNNDGPATRVLPEWSSVHDYAEIECDGAKLVLCHYPFRTWNGMYKGALNLHGHSHGQLKPLLRQIDVGVDVWYFRPVTLAQLRVKLRIAA